MTTLGQSRVNTEDGVEVSPRGHRRSRHGRSLLGLAVGGALLLAGLGVPYVVTGTYRMGLFLEAALLGMLALGIGFLARHLGLISIGHTAFFGVSAFTVGIAMNRWEWSPLEAVGLAVLVGSVTALLMGVLVVRASGIGFLMLTLALSQALYALNLQSSLRPWTGAHDGLLIVMQPDASFLGLDQAGLQNPGLFWPVVWIALCVCAMVLWLVGRSGFGTTMAGIRENEERMRFSGYNTFVPRLVAFVLSGVVAAVGGALFALNAGYVSPDVLGFQQAGDALIATLIGGYVTLLGPLLGVALFVYGQASLNVGGNLHLFTGVALILVMVFLPGGITGTVQRRFRRRRSRHAAGGDDDSSPGADAVPRRKELGSAVNENAGGQQRERS